MLFDVAAVLVTSAALGPAAEVSVAPAGTSIVLVVDTGSSSSPDATSGSGVLIDPAAIGPATTGSSVSVVDFSLSPVTRAQGGISLLRNLASLSAGDISKLVRSDPKLVSQLLASPPSARDVSSLWSSMTPSARARLTKAAPRLVGSLDGFPFAVRNSANRVWISQSIDSLASRLPGVGGRALAESDQRQLDMLRSVQTSLKPSKGKASPTRSLLSVDPSGEGKAVIVLGDLQTADYVTYMVPGMFYTVDGQLGAWTGDAADLYAQQVSWLHRLSATDPADAHKTVAVVAWMGYQTPDLTNIGSLSLANKGRDALANAIEGLQAQRGAHQPYTTVLAHSYGSTAALMALTQDDFTVDALAIVGSPGSAAQSSKDLHVRDNNVWVGAAAWDPVPNSAFFGSDPSAASYGAHVMGVGGATDVITGAKLAASLGHNEYFDPHTESLRNMALIGIGHPELVLQGTSTDARRTLALEH